MQGRKFGALLIPDWLGNVDNRGVALGPRILYNEVIESDKLILRKPIANYIEYCKEVNFPDPSSKHNSALFKDAKYFSEIDSIQLDVRDEVKYILDNRMTPIVFLGDDSSLIGTLSAFLSNYGNDDFGILYCDAHADLNTPNTTLTGKIYGMCLGFLMQLQNHTMKCNENLPPLIGKNIYMLGNRSFDPEEFDLLCDSGIQRSSADEVNYSNNTSGKVIDYFKSNGIENIFFHVDADVIDPVESPGVILQEERGVNSKKLLNTIEQIASRVNVIGLSVSEFVPELDPECKTQKIMANVVERVVESSIL